MLQLMQAMLSQQGMRRLLVISGQAQWCREQATDLLAPLVGDKLWIGDIAPENWPKLSASAARTLLGQERLHAIFDAGDGLDIEALAIVSGVLSAGSWLLLLVPPWSQWPLKPDGDSIRWSDSKRPIATPHFVHHMQQQLLADNEVSFWHQGQELQLASLPERALWQKPQGEPTSEQQAILAQLQQGTAGIWVLTAARGRGKSTLAGMLMAHLANECWITGPNHACAQVACYWAQGNARFWAPDALLAHCQEHGNQGTRWLFIDEAAAVPAPLLQRLISYFPCVLMSTTVQGYEGTGRGFLLKFCSSLPDVKILNLYSPMRWADGDALERVIDNILLFNEEPCWKSKAQKVNLQQLNSTQLCTDKIKLKRFYGLLASAHYRTSPLDLRRMMDAPGMYFSVACSDGEEEIIGALWGVAEGGLSHELAQEVWAGRRRPRGNLVAQSLAAHCGIWWAPMLRSMRISRIAVLPDFQRQGIAKSLIKQLYDSKFDKLDYLAVSFGFTEPLWQFWHNCGFHLVRIGNKKESNSGCYNAMALLPLSEQGEKLCKLASDTWQRNWYWLQQYISVNLPIISSEKQNLNEDDWCELIGFACAHRSLEASIGALHRLLLICHNDLSLLRQYLYQQASQAQCVKQLGLTGKKVLLLLWRQEVARVLEALNREHYYYWQSWLNKIITK